MPAHAPTTPVRARPDYNPGHDLYNASSADTDGPRSGLLRRLLSVAASSRDSDRASPSAAAAANATLARRASLVPPNYAPVFAPPQAALRFVRASRESWGLSLVALPDNGVRAELRDMYAIFVSMEERPLALDLVDVDLFSEWFAGFTRVLAELFLLEERCLYAWVEGTDLLTEDERLWEATAGRVKGELSEAKRMLRKGEIMSKAEDVKDCRCVFEGGPVLQGLPRLAKAVAAFVAELLAYLELKEARLPPLVEQLRKPKDRVRFEKVYWQTAMSLPGFQYTVVAATRWMTRTELRKWKTKYFAARGKGMYGKWRSLFNEKHYSLVTAFAERVHADESERLRQMQEHDQARARAQDAPFGVEDDEESERASRLSGSCVSSFHKSNASTALAAMSAIC